MNKEVKQLTELEKSYIELKKQEPLKRIVTKGSNNKQLTKNIR